jgi:stalled ribosome alternative rescue factor ArfA|tara:strand:- start:325 stop:510 length:186 start_codon:yes stop_codon:yes gene_type:complete
MADRVHNINRVARVMAHNRRRYSQQVVQPKKGKGSYERKDEKNVTRSEAQSYMGKGTPDES